MSDIIGDIIMEHIFQFAVFVENWLVAMVAHKILNSFNTNIKRVPLTFLIVDMLTYIQYVQFTGVTNNNNNSCSLFRHSSSSRAQQVCVLSLWYYLLTLLNRQQLCL